jgi:hypothetical protein
MSQAVDLLAREAEIVRIIKILSPESDRFVVIGGYAINALAAHRYSVDCDLVTDSRGLKEIEKILDKEGYQSHAGFQRHQVYGIKMKKYLKKINGRPVSVEIFPVELTCRQTESMSLLRCLSPSSACTTRQSGLRSGYS